MYPHHHAHYFPLPPNQADQTASSSLSSKMDQSFTRDPFHASTRMTSQSLYPTNLAPVQQYPSASAQQHSSAPTQLEPSHMLYPKPAAPSRPTAAQAYQHHSRYLRVHMYTPNFLPAGLVGRDPVNNRPQELHVECTLFPAPGRGFVPSTSFPSSQPTSPMSAFPVTTVATMIRLCFANMPLATQVVRSTRPSSIASAAGPSPPGSQELRLSCAIPNWNDVVESSPKLRLGGMQGKVSLFVEVMGDHQGGPGPERVLERIWFGEFEYMHDEQQPHNRGFSWTNSFDAPSKGLEPSLDVRFVKRPGSPLSSPRQQPPGTQPFPSTSSVDPNSLDRCPPTQYQSPSGTINPHAQRSAYAPHGGSYPPPQQFPNQPVAYSSSGPYATQTQYPHQPSQSGHLGYQPSPSQGQPERHVVRAQVSDSFGFVESGDEGKGERGLNVELGMSSRPYYQPNPPPSMTSTQHTSPAELGINSQAPIISSQTHPSPYPSAGPGSAGSNQSSHIRHLSASNQSVSSPGSAFGSMQIGGDRNNPNAPRAHTGRADWGAPSSAPGQSTGSNPSPHGMTPDHYSQAYAPSPAYASQNTPPSLVTPSSLRSSAQDPKAIAPIKPPVQKGENIGMGEFPSDDGMRDRSSSTSGTDPTLTPSKGAFGGPKGIQSTMKATLELQSDLGLMAIGWNHAEWITRRRLVQFWRRQESRVIQSTFRPISQADYVDNSIVISCIYRDDTNECYVTSVDTIYLLEALIGTRFSVEEKNRIRRNLEGLKPETISKNKPATEEFFKLIMGLPKPKPRNIEKDVKVFKWSHISDALVKIVGKYSVVYDISAVQQTPVNIVPGPLRRPPIDGSQPIFSLSSDNEDLTAMPSFPSPMSFSMQSTPPGSRSAVPPQSVPRRPSVFASTLQSGIHQFHPQGQPPSQQSSSAAPMISNEYAMSPYTNSPLTDPFGTTPSFQPGAPSPSVVGSTRSEGRSSDATSLGFGFDDFFSSSGSTEASMPSGMTTGPGMGTGTGPFSRSFGSSFSSERQI